MAKYMQDSNDIQINDVSGTDNINFSFKNGNSIDTKIGDLTDLETPTTDNLVGAINSIVESGSNANGNYVKFADGTMICRRTTNLGSVDINKAWGNFYESTNAYEVGNFPQPFIETPEISVMPRSPFFVEKYGDTDNTKWEKIYPTCPRTKTENPCIVYSIAIGRWK